MRKARTKRTRSKPGPTVEIHFTWVGEKLVEDQSPIPDPTLAPAVMAKWLELFEQEVTARKYAGKDFEAPDLGNRVRAWWRCVGDLLKEYEIRTVQGFLLKPEPVEIVGKLAALAHYLAIGQIPEPIRRVAKEGRRAPGPTELREIQLASAYRAACRPEGLQHNGKTITVADHHPIVTLTGWFNITRRAILRWIADYPPAFLGVNDVDGRILARLTQEAGRSYSQRGRSASAVLKRDKKRGRPKG